MGKTQDAVRMREAQYERSCQRNQKISNPSESVESRLGSEVPTKLKRTKLNRNTVCLLRLRMILVMPCLLFASYT